jgi:hypothetical protein
VAVSLIIDRFLSSTWLNLAKQKLLLGIRNSWRGRVGVDCNSVSGMRLEMPSKQESQMSLISIKWLPVNEIGSRPWRRKEDLGSHSPCLERL